MDFQKKNWQFRDLITEGELNRMEDGIEEGITKAEQAEQMATQTANELAAHLADETIHVTQQEKDKWNAAAEGGGVPRGAIIMWSGGIDDIPTGWALCDGTNGTPDLRDRFIVGAGGEYAVGDTGGAKEVSLTTAQLPSHSHGSGTLSTSSAGSHSHGSGTLTTNTTGSHTHSNYARTVNIVEGSLPIHAFGPTLSSALATASAGSHSHTISGSTASAGSHSHSISGSTSSVGSGQAHENRPPYFALAYIMKL